MGGWDERIPGLLDDADQNPLLAGLLGNPTPSGPGMPNPTMPGVQMAQPNPLAGMPAPHAAALPPGAPPPPPSFMDRVKGAFSHVQDTLMPATGAASMLTGDQLDSARRGALIQAGLSTLANSRGVNGGAAPSAAQALAAGVQSGTGAFQSAAQRVVEGNMLRQQQDQQQKIQATRDAIAKQFPPPTSGSEADLAKWTQQVYPLLLASGDEASIRALSPVIEKYAMAGAANKTNVHPQAVQTGDGVTTFDPNKGFFDPKTKTWVPAVDRGLPKDKLEEDALNRQLRELALKQGYQEFQIKGAENTARAFQNQNKALTDATTLYSNAKASIAEARTNPGASKSAILNFAAAADSKAQLRMGTINFIKQIDPSFTGNLKSFFSRFTTGKVPPEQLDMMEQVLDHIHSDQAALYEQRRAGAVTRNPLAEGYIPPTEEIFGSPTAPAAPVTGGNKVRNMMGTP